MLAIFLDIETTGLDPLQHSPIEIAFRVVDMTRLQSLSTYSTIIKHPIEVWNKRDPSSIAINGFRWEQIQQGTPLPEVQEHILKIFSNFKIERGKAVFICQNPSFDRSFFAQIVPVYTQEKLHWPYHWLDLASMFWTVQVQTMHKTQVPFPESINLSKNSIAKAYNLPIESIPHSAMKGVDHLIKCYEAVLGVTIHGL